MRPPPRSCDTFVCVRAATDGVGPACTLFGKNSDRPSEEAHEVLLLATHVPTSLWLVADASVLAWVAHEEEEDQ